MPGVSGKHVDAHQDSGCPVALVTSFSARFLVISGHVCLRPASEGLFVFMSCAGTNAGEPVLRRNQRARRGGAIIRRKRSELCAIKTILRTTEKISWRAAW